MRRHTLGKVGSPHTVEEAREAASELLRQVKAGQDPMQAKREINEAVTVTELIEAYLHEGRIAKPNKGSRHGRATPRSCDGTSVPCWGIGWRAISPDGISNGFRRMS